MDLIEPKILTMDDILENNLVPDPNGNWNPGTAYTVEPAVTTVKVPWEQDQSTLILPPKLYELIADSVVDHYPPLYQAEWLDKDATNRWAMFGEHLYLPSIAQGDELIDPGKIVLKIKSGKQNAIGLFGMVATGVTFDLYDSSDNLLNTEFINLVDSSNIFSWSTFFYEDRFHRKDILHDFDLYHVSSLKITIEDTRENSMPQLGYCLIGHRRYLGQTKYGLRTTALDFGDTFAKILEADAHIDPNKMVYIQGLLSKFYDIPIILQANNKGIDFENFLVLGKYKSFDIVYSNARRIPLNINIQGLTEQKR